MTAIIDDKPQSMVIDNFLSLLTAEQRLSFLENEYLNYTEALHHLLDEAAESARSDPFKARRLAAVCSDLAAQLEIGDVIPRADYIQAQTYALAGEFARALDLIEKARNGFNALGQQQAVMRTTAGLLHVLGELGRYQEALDVAQSVLDETGRQPLATSPLAPVAALMHQNMGMCYTLSGRFDEALEAHNAAEALFLDIGMTAQAADVSNNRGVLLWELGRGTEALAAFESALSGRATGGQTQLHAQSLANIGSAHLLLGNYTASLDYFEKARRLYSLLDKLVDQHVLLLDTATAYLSLNLYPEALTAFHEAEELLRSTGAVHHRIRALWGTGAAQLALGRLEFAQHALSEAVELSIISTNAPTPLLATLLLEQAAIQAAKRQYAHAIATAEQAYFIVRDNNWPVQEIYTCLQLADLAREDLSQIEDYLTTAQRLANPIGVPHFRYRLHHRFGRLRQLQGRDQEAQIHLEAAITEIEQLRGSLVQDTMRTSFLQDKTVVYHDLIKLHLVTDNAPGRQSAFEVAEEARSRALLDLISGVITPTADPKRTDDIDIVRLQQLQADLNAVYNQLLNGGSAESGTFLEESEVRYAALHVRATELEGAINQLRMRDTSAGSLDPWVTPMTLPEIQAHLPDDVTLVSYQIIEDEILAFVVDRHSLNVIREMNKVSEVKPMVQRLGGMLDRLRAGEALNGKLIHALESSARRVLAKLYQALLAPLDPLLKTATRENPVKLVIIPHTFLHHLPFHALHDGYGYVIDYCEISYAPSATIYAVCQQRPLRVEQNPIIVGVPDPAIPEVVTEIQNISRRIPSARVLFDHEATWAALQASVPGASLLHLACHGLFRADNPMFSALKLHDGWLMAGDAAALELSDALVTLSACESGRSQIVGGDELLGLLRAFLGAGAATVIVSLWLAQDDTTARLMYNMYSELLDRGSNPAAALRAAQLTLKTEYPHPYYWAPFIAVGHR